MEAAEFTTLLKNQQEIGDKIIKIVNNYKKANASQKSKESWLTQKIEEAQQLFSQFEQNHKLIMENQEVDPKCNYFEIHYFDTITGIYDQNILIMLQQREHLHQQISNLGETSFPSKDNSSSNLIKLQRRAVLDFNQKLAKIKDKSLQEREFWLETLKAQLISIKNRADTIFLEVDDSGDIPDDVSSDVLFELENQLITELSKMKTSQSMNLAPIEKDGNLMKIKLNPFNGDFLKWPTFKNLYNEMVHNKPYSDTLKMVYLQQLLTDEAESVLGQADLSQESYQDTWTRIQESFDNKRKQTVAVANRFFNQPHVKEDSASDIKKLFTFTKECIVSLKAMGITLGNAEPLFVILLLRKIDDDTRQIFENKLTNPKENPTMNEFLEFLENRFQALESMDKKSKPSKQSKPSTSSHVNLVSKSDNSSKCLSCDGSHRLFECKIFKALDVAKRWNFTKKHKLCAICFQQGHFSLQCKWKPCPKTNCGKKHNSLLHDDQHKKNSDVKEDDAVNKALCHTVGKSSSEDDFLFLGTAMVKAEAKNGKLCNFRAVLDTGSQMNIITESCCQALGLKPSIKSQKFNGVGGGLISCNKKVNIKICSNDLSFSCRIEAFVVPKITSYQPKEQLDINQILKERDLRIDLADPSFNNPQSIDILLDGQVCVDTIHNGKIKLGSGLPTLVSSSFGWIIMGKLRSDVNKTPTFCGILNIPKLWDVEEPETPRQLYSSEDKAALKIFDETTKFVDGRLCVELPKQDVMELGESFTIAKTRFHYLEKRFLKNEKLFGDYKKFMQEYLALGHMVETDLSSLPEKHYFLPHHPVFKETSTTTKIRVVFDASAKSANNFSLNDVLLKGPTVQDDLFNHLTRFRFPRYAMCADLEKMYRQIRVFEDDQYLQLILWRENPLDPLKIFKLCTITYGTKPAPFLATNCLNKISHETSETSPLASPVIRRNFYVDDLITGSDDLSIAIQTQKQLIQTFSSYGFRLRKWCANSLDLLNNIPENDREMQWNLQDGQEVIKTLGLIWNPVKDSFLISCAELDVITKITKRVVASEAGQIFDPLGLVQPTVVLAKIMLQKIWLVKLGWDEELPSELSEYWIKFRSQLYKLNSISVNRHVVITNYTHIELHGFSDASEKAYGAVIYVRSTNTSGQILVSLLCSKSKVAPLSKKSIAKLELCGARLLAELMEKVKTCINYHINDTYYWCDSKISLAWIKNPSSSYKTFVGNRVSIIQDLSKSNQWFHIPGNNNPADVVSRGLFPEDLKNCSLWFSGPSFLSMSKDQWPIPTSVSEDSEEFTNAFKKCSLITSVPSDPIDIFQNINHHNSMVTLHRIFAFILRFNENCKLQTNSNKTIRSMSEVQPLSVEELDIALKKIIYLLQVKYQLHKEIRNSLKTLSPFKDSEGLLRVGGRLHLSSSLSFDAKHPYLLPNCFITKLLIIEIHHENYHAAPQTLLSLVRQRFWPINGKRLVNKVFHECMRCFRTRPRDIFQLMGYLPEKRVTPAAPFSYTGVDFAGPFIVHQAGRGNKPRKIYLAVFVCFTVKAVHLELVSELTSKAFIACLRRFVSRRGKLIEIFSDNATNFVGAREELKPVKDFITNKDNLTNIQSNLHHQGIKWSLIPARSPHFGGLWEASVKRAKFHLKDIVNRNNVTYEELLTITTEVEAVLNSRPLVPISSNANDLRALTPFDFLIQGQFSNIKVEEHISNSSKLIKRWNVIDSIRQEFWHRWVTEYLHTQQQKQKWTKTCPNIKEGTLVILKDSNISPLNWKLGLVQKTYQGNDNLTRVVDVKTSTGVRSRAITQICPLPEISNDDEILKNLPKISQSSTNTTTNRTQSNSISNHIAIRKSNSKLNSRIMNNIFSTLLFALLICPILGENISKPNYNVTKFESHAGIFYDGISNVNIIENKWHILMYYNLSSYWSQCTYFSGWLVNIKALCSDQISKQTIWELEHQLKDITDLNEIIRKECQLVEFLKAKDSAKRSRRGAVNVIGNVANALFGVLDNQYAEKVEQSFVKVKKNEVHMLDLIRNQTIVIDATSKVIKKNNEQILSEFNIIRDQINNFTRHSVTNDNKIEFNGVIAYLSLVLRKYRETQLHIHKVLSTFKMGRLDALLISPEELEEQLKNIQYHVSSRFKLPSFHFEELEKIVDVAVVHGIFSLIFQVEIPLLNVNDFKLYKMIPAPTTKNGEFVAVKPMTSHLAINSKSKIYYLLNDKDINDCIPMNQLIICNKHHPMHEINSHSHCEVKIFLQEDNSFDQCNYQRFFHNQIWFELHTPNHWLFSLRNTENCKLECDETMEKIKLSGEGILSIYPGCKLEVSGTSITGKEILSSVTILKNIIPSKIIPMNITIPTLTNISSKPLVVKLNDLSSVNHVVEDLKLQESLDMDYQFIENPNLHDCLIYVLMVLIFVALLFVIIKVKFLMSTKSVIEPIELQSTPQQDNIPSPGQYSQHQQQLSHQITSCSPQNINSSSSHPQLNINQHFQDDQNLSNRSFSFQLPLNV